MAIFCLFFCELYEILVMNYGKNGSAQQTIVIVGMDSCDEAQRMTVYQAGYRAFLNTNITCVVLFVISFVCAVLFHTGLLAFVMIGVIWMVNNMSYMIKGAKLEKGK